MNDPYAALYRTRKTRKRFVLNITEELHKEIKSRANFRNITMTDWLMIAIAQRIEEEMKYTGTLKDELIKP